MTYWDYVQDQKDLGKKVEYTIHQYKQIFYRLRKQSMKRGRVYDAKGIPTKKFKKGYNRTGGNYGRYNGPNAELKFLDVVLDDALIATAGTITDSVNLIPQGVTESTRVGRKCTIKKIGWKYTMTIAAQSGGAIATSDTCRIIMFLDKQCNGATAAVLDVLQTADWDSFRNLANSQRFRILHDKSYDLNVPGLAGDGTTNDSGSVTMTGSFYKDCNLPLEFDATSGAITTIRSNNVGVLLISRGGIIRVQSVVRVRFSDGS